MSALPTWLQLVIAVSGLLASWRWIVRPLRRAYRELIRVLKQISNASGGVLQLGQELHVLAGAFTRYAIGNAEQIVELRERMDTIGQLFIDLSADISRLQRRDPEEHHDID